MLLVAESRKLDDCAFSEAKGMDINMSKKYYAVVGQWGYVQTDPMGISTYRYDLENGDFELIEKIREDIVSGQLCVDTERGVIYVVNEVGHIRGDLGGGGYVLAFRMDPDTGKLTLLSEKRSLSTEPCYLCLDSTKQFLLVSHNSDPFHVTKIRQLEDGSYTSDTVYDDTALVMFPVGEDGSLGDVCDVSITYGCGAGGPHSKSFVHPVSGHIMHIQVISRQHSVTGSPDGELYAVCDRGMNKIYTYRIDRENGKLVQMHEYDEYSEDIACSPRYGAFHPTRPYFYANSERVPYILGYRYNSQECTLEKICRTKAVFEDTKIISGCCDLLMHPNGKYLYSTSMPATISMLAIEDDGTLTLKQNIECGGDYPRAICISPDERFLFSGNNHSTTITSFTIAEDGTLSPTGKVFAGAATSAMKIFSLD